MSEVLIKNKNAFIIYLCQEIFFCKNSGVGIVCMGSAGSFSQDSGDHCDQNIAKWESFGLAE